MLHLSVEGGNVFKATNILEILLTQYTNQQTFPFRIQLSHSRSCHNQI